MNYLHLGEREVCFSNYKKTYNNENWTDNLLEHSNHQNIKLFLVFGRETK